MRFREVLLLIGTIVFSAISSITVTENSARRFSFVFDMEGYSLAQYKKGDSTYSRVSFKESNCRLYSDGEVALPSKSFYVGVPQTGTIRVRFVSQSVKRIVLDHPLPADSVGFHSFENVTPPFINPWISKETYVRFRRMRTGFIYIRPFIYDPHNRRLTVLLKGTCTIEFPRAAKRSIRSRQLAGDYYAMLRELVLNYSVAKQWLRPPKHAVKRRQVQAILPANETMVRFSVGDGNEGVNEATTEENGIVKIVPGDITSFFNNRMYINSISLFGSQREELNDTVPADTTIPDGVYEIPLLRVDENGNNLFDGNDYILAYVTGISDWYYDTALDDFAYQFNRLENHRHYWLRATGGSKTIKPFVCAGAPLNTVSLFENRIRYKKSKQLMTDNEGKGGIEWIWMKLTKTSGSFSYKVPFPYINPLYTGYIRTNRGNSSSSYRLQVFFGDSLLTDTLDWRPVSNWNDSILTMALKNPGDNTYYELQSLDVKYRQDLDMQGKNSMRVFSPGSPDSGIVQYQVSNLPLEKTYIFRISSDERNLHLIDTISAGGIYTWVDTAGIGIQYIISTTSGLLSVSDSVEVYYAGKEVSNEIVDLRNTNNMSDYIIITHSTFKDQANDLADHKGSINSFTHPRVVDVENIYREFSGGNQDQSAIRNFLFYAANFWTPVAIGADPGPDYVVLFGNGHYDYKNYSTQEKLYLPTAQIKMQSAYKCVEDFFSCIDSGHVFDSNIAPHLFLGRIPCNNTVEARNVVDKIVDMEGSAADWGAWRNRVLLVSDDDRQGFEKDFIEHYIGNEAIDRGIREQQPATEIRKVILFEYEWNELFQKPEATAALLNEFNNGNAIVNFFGHGNQSAWTDEGVLNKDKVVMFTNHKRYPVVNSFSCAVAYFDKPDMTSFSELMITAADAGAIVTIASARTAFATKNTEMSKEFFRIFYENNTSWTVGQAYSFTKLTQNLKHYVLLGDPSIKFIQLTDSVAMDIIKADGSPLPYDTLITVDTICQGIDTIITVDTLINERLSALQQVTVRGKILRNNTINTLFGTSGQPAYVQLGLYNPVQDSVKRKDGGTFSDPTYCLPGTPVFVGKLEVAQGRFEQKILIPRNVAFKKPKVTLTAYAYTGKDFALGHKGDLIFIGSASNLVTNSDGPRITVRPVYDTAIWNSPVGFTDKISSFLPLECEISVWDENGIDVSGLGPDEGLTYEINDKRSNINHQFIFDEGKFTKGHANIIFAKNTERSLETGTYEMTIRAQDLLGKVSKVVITLEILNEEDFKLGHVFNYPNPVRMGGMTRFYFYHSNTSETKHDRTKVAIKIFTLSGKLIKVFPQAINGQPWDLTDQRGNRLTPNVYLYRVTAKMLRSGMSGNEKIVKSPIRKLVIHPPR